MFVLNTSKQISTDSKILVPGIFPITDTLALCELKIINSILNASPIYNPMSTLKIITPKNVANVPNFKFIYLYSN